MPALRFKGRHFDNCKRADELDAPVQKQFSCISINDSYQRAGITIIDATPERWLMEYNKPDKGGHPPGAILPLSIPFSEGHFRAAERYVPPSHLQAVQI